MAQQRIFHIIVVIEINHYDHRLIVRSQTDLISPLILCLLGQLLINLIQKA